MMRFHGGHFTDAVGVLGSSLSAIVAVHEVTLLCWQQAWAPHGRVYHAGGLECWLTRGCSLRREVQHLTAELEASRATLRANAEAQQVRETSIVPLDSLLLP